MLPISSFPELAGAGPAWGTDVTGKEQHICGIWPGICGTAPMGHSNSALPPTNCPQALTVGHSHHNQPRLPLSSSRGPQGFVGLPLALLVLLGLKVSAPLFCQQRSLLNESNCPFPPIPGRAPKVCGCGTWGQRCGKPEQFKATSVGIKEKQCFQISKINCFGAGWRKKRRCLILLFKLS